MNRQHKIAFTAFALTGVLGACATAPPPQTPEDDVPVVNREGEFEEPFSCIEDSPITDHQAPYCEE